MKWRLKLKREEENPQEDAENKVIKYADLLFPILNIYAQWAMFRTVNPHKAYFWLRSSNAYLFAEAMAKNELKQILDYLKPLKGINYIGIVMIIFAFALAVIAIWIFTQGGTHVPTVVPKPPSVPPISTPVVINK
jgi:hypothetical protein